MKGMKIFMGLLAIFLVQRQVTAVIVFTISDITSVIEWGLKLCDIYDKIDPDDTDKNFKNVLKNITAVSKDLNRLDSRLNKAFDKLYSSIVDDLTIEIGMLYSREKLILLIERVNNYYKDSIKYQFKSRFQNETLKKFTDKVLYSPYNVPDALRNIHDIFVPGVDHRIFPGYFSLISQGKSTKAKTECPSGVSVQQQIYYIFTQLIMAEMKGMVTLTKAYVTRSVLNKNPMNFSTELTDARKNFESRVNEYHYECIKNMKPLLSRIRPCQLPSPRPNIDFTTIKFPSTLGEHTIESISITKQLSDIEQNKVVTGVRFVMFENALYLQIQQGIVMKGGVVFGEKQWKEIHREEGFGSKSYQRQLSYQPFDKNSNLYLDEIRTADDRTVVTGVRFDKPSSGMFMLSIRATVFNPRTGQLMKNESFWYRPLTNTKSVDAYRQHREEIKLVNVDNPLKGTNFTYSPTNKIIKPTLTADKKIMTPFIDLQTVETQPGFALSGIGITYRGSNGYGGYIAPEIYAYPISSEN